MSSNKKTFRQNKLGKAIKATLPLFVMLGGGTAAASTRNFSASSGSRRISATSVVHVSDTDEPIKLNQRTDNKVSKKATVFGAFTKGRTKAIKPAEIKVDNAALDFLKENNLLNSGESVKAQLSGNTLGRKTFVDFCFSVDVRNDTATYVPHNNFAQSLDAQIGVIVNNNNQTACTVGSNVWHITNGGSCSLGYYASKTNAAACVGPGASYLWSWTSIVGTVGGVAPNTAPTATNRTQTVNFTEDLTAAIANIVIIDSDADTWTATITMAAGDNSLGSLSTTGGGSFNTGTGVWTITSATLATVNNALAAMQFVPKANVSTTTTASVSISDGVNPAITGTITFNGTAVNDAPTLGGITAVTNIDDTATATPFSAFTVADVDSPAQTQTVSVTLDLAAKGSFTTLNGFADAGAGVYTFSGTAAATQTAIQGLVFTPTSNRVASGLTETTTFTVSVYDGVATAVTNSATTVVSTSVNDAPTITGASAGQAVNDNATVSPFTGVTLGDADSPAQTQSVSVTLDVAAKGSFTTLNGFTDAGAGVYTFSGTAAAATTAINGLVFTPTADRVNPTLTETTTFTISVDDGVVATAVTNNTTTVIATAVNDAPTLGGATAVTNINDTATATPFSAFTVADADTNQSQSVSVTLDVAAKGSFTTLNGFADATGGVYTFTGTAAAAQTAIQGLVFTPTANRVTPTTTETTTFTVSVNDGIATAVTNSVTTVVSTSVNDAPTLGGITAVTNIDDIATATPFSAFTVADVDSPAQSQTVSVTLDVAAKGSFTTLNGFTDAGAGVYTFSGTAAATQTAIQGLVFTPTSNRVASGLTETTIFTVSVDDGVAAAVTNNATTVVSTSVNDAPTITGASAGQAVNDNATVSPFTGVTLGDADSPAQTLAVSISRDVTAKGSFTTLNGFTDTGANLYTFNGTAAQAQTAMRGLVFTPTADRVSPGSTETTTFTISVDDSVAAPVTNNATTVVSTAVNDAPTLGGVTAVTYIDDTATATPFSAFTISDADSTQTLAVSISRDVTAKGSFTTLNGFTDTGANLYTFSGTAAQAQSAIRGLIFTPTANRVTSGLTETTIFTVSVNDGIAAPVTNNATTVVSMSVNDAPTNIGLTTSIISQSATGPAANVGTLSSTDIDNASFTYSLVNSGTAANGLCGVGNDTGNGSFQISAASLQTQSALVSGSYQLCLQTSDGGSTFEKAFTVTVSDNVGPVISAVSIPMATMKVGDVVTAMITVTSDADDYTTGSGGISGSIGGFTLGSLSKTNNTTYEAQFTVTEGGTDVTAGNDIPVSFTLNDSLGNISAAYTAAIAQSGDRIDANSPVVSSVEVPANNNYNTSSNLDFTVRFNESISSVGSSTLGLTIGASDVNATYLSNTGSSVTYRYVVQAGDFDADGITVGSITANTDTFADNAGNNANLTLQNVAPTTGVRIDAVVPAAPSVPDMTTATDTGASDTDNQTGVSTPVFTGSAEAGSTVTLISSVQGTIGSGVATAGNWSITASTLSLGAHNITATATDVAGNVSVASSALAIVILSDLDGDGDPDVNDPDIDGDGMSNAYEDANGLDKLDANDRDTDLDGDGVSNYDESVADTNANADDYPPVVTPPADVDVDATGLFTAVDTDVATATDGLDGSVIATSDASTHFAPGINTVTWSATDAAGNIGKAEQLVNVTPLVGFSIDQTAREGDTITIKAILNGNPVSYPVDVPYTVSGTAATDLSDHNLADGIISITASNLEASSVNIVLVDDGAGEGDETIIVTMGTPTNAVKGSTDIHTTTITENNLAPEVVLTADQSSGTTSLVTQADGSVTVTATVTDSTGDIHSYDWLATDNALSDTDGTADDATFNFDPASLQPGVYTLRVSVADDKGGNSDADLILNVVATAPVLTATDTDGDGTDDDVEGHGDNDNDGVVNYLDNGTLTSNVTPGRSATANQFLMETEPGLKVRLGKVAFRAGKDGINVNMDDVTTHANDGAGATADNRHDYNSGMFDFEIHKLPVAGQSIRVVLAQQATIPANAIYRKYANGVWQQFVEDDNNSVASATGVEGYCPPPGDVAYTAELTEGDWCVQITIEDGGPNDADGKANRSISDPGGVTESVSSSGHDNNSILDDLRDAAGSANPLWLLMILGLLPLRRKELGANRKKH